MRSAIGMIKHDMRELDGRARDDIGNRREALMSSENELSSNGRTLRIWPVVTGLILFLVLLLLPPPSGLSEEGWRCAAIALLMAFWWITEAIPIPATALLPLVLLPLTGVFPFTESVSSYAHRLIFLFMGGFMIAQAMQRWNLHKRIALILIGFTGNKAGGIVAGFMIATAALSMWVSNTATTLMMLPIGISVVASMQGEFKGPNAKNFGPAVMLGIAYGATLGGVTTLIGTPPNSFMAGFLDKTYGYTLGFDTWMLIGLPLGVLMMPLAWLLLTRILFPVPSVGSSAATTVLDEERAKLGAMSTAEWVVLIVFTLTALTWIFRRALDPLLDWVKLDDGLIAMVGALSLFLIPVRTKPIDFALNWEWAQRIPWGILLLFGGGLTLAGAISKTGLAAWLGGLTGYMGGFPIFFIAIVIAAMVILLTELTSNTATTATFLPIVAAIALGLGENPLILVVPAALAASFAFMLPVATPPNAIVFGSGHITMAQMVRAGVWLNILGLGMIILLSYTVVPMVLDVAPGVLPDWAAAPVVPE